MVERGDATAEDVDTAMELGAGYRESLLCFQKKIADDASHGRKLATDEAKLVLTDSHSNYLIS